MARFDFDDLAVTDDHVGRFGRVFAIPCDCGSAFVLKGIQLKRKGEGLDRKKEEANDAVLAAIALRRTAKPSDTEQTLAAEAEAERAEREAEDEWENFLSRELIPYIEQALRQRDPKVTLARTADDAAKGAYDFAPMDLLMMLHLIVTGGSGVRTPEDQVAEALTGKDAKQREKEAADIRADAAASGKDPPKRSRSRATARSGTRSRASSPS